MASNARKKRPGRSRIILDGNHLKLDDLEAIADGAGVALSPAAKKRIEKCREYVLELSEDGLPHYGINTGFGYLASVAIPDDQLRELQKNLVRSHAAGWGELLEERESRLALALRLNVFAKGLTGVRLELCEQILKLLRARIHPAIPEYGSLGASGDLIPLSHLALPLSGEGEVYYKGRRMSARRALKAAKIKPLELARKEGLSLINGTQIMQAVGSLALARALKVLEWAEKVTALSFEGLAAIPDTLFSPLHKARGQYGQEITARNILKELRGSEIHKNRPGNVRLQDPYSLRCAPQIIGPSRDALEYAADVAECELNAATDNPLVFTKQKKIVSGGNFHGQAISMAYDFAAIAMAEIASVSERRLELMLNPNYSGLPAFLVKKPGLNSGYMTLQYLAGSLVNENRVLAHPACVDNITGNVGVEDHVSMGMTAARKLKRIVKNTEAVIACELLAAAQAVDLRGLKKLGQGTERTYRLVRKRVSELGSDRTLYPEIEEALKVLERL
ncbi:MAG: histidine ammonia-lyase [Candidatus Dadabacteria bacterium]|nr:MAG: histidine ammonia-lyase [Candidatus Dadabacteria bacterium]